MTGPDLLALSLVLSVAAAGLGLAVMRAVERRVADPALREWGWAAALYIPALPPLVVAAMLLTPAAVETAPSSPPATAASTVLIEVQSAAAPGLAALASAAAPGALVIAGALAIVGLAVLAFRLFRLRRLVRAAAPASAGIQRLVDGLARETSAPVPAVRVCAASTEALLTGLRRPVLVLPAALTGLPDAPALRAVCAHELAHLRRGDHRTLWLEELLLAVAMFNPLLRAVRDHRAAAREEACDALALAGAGEAQRRLYARALLDAVRTSGVRGSAPALTFTSARRTFVMNRLKAVLAPASPAGRRSRRTVAGLSALVAGLTLSGSFAVAAQRQTVIVEAPAERPAEAPSTMPDKVSAPIVAALPDTFSPPAASGEQAQPVVVPEPYKVQEQPAPAPDGQVREISRVTWRQHPTPMYPATAAANGITGGTVSLTCIIEADNSASDCDVVSETPEGQGFGEAALASMEGARFSETLMETTTPGARARFTIRFRVAE